MALRATERGDQPVHEDTEHTMLGHWEAGRWRRVIDQHGAVIAETSDWVQAQEIARQTHGILQRAYRFVPAVHQWHDVTEDEL